MTRGFTGLLTLSPEVERALIRAQPVVALETSLVAHGLPHPHGLEAALRSEQRVRDAGGVPATIAVLDGAVRVGLEPSELEALATAERVRKVAPRDLAPAVVSGRPGATTVAGTLAVCRIAGIHFLHRLLARELVDVAGNAAADLGGTVAAIEHLHGSEITDFISFGIGSLSRTHTASPSLL